MKGKGGTKKNGTIKMADDFIMQTYKRIPVVITRGKGVYLWDDAGRKYMDFLGARGAANTGYSNPDVIRAVTGQAKKLMLVTNDFYTRPQAEFARMLVKHSCADRVFFCNSGAEANEGAIKLSRLYSYRSYGQGRYVIVSAHNSFHGRTYGALSATAQRKYQAGFGPMVPGFRSVAFNDPDDMTAALGDDVCAVILEPVQGEGGVYPATREYIRLVRDITQKKDILFIMDEVQVGLGRTGRLFAYENYGIRPDIVTIAKSIAGGMPMAAFLASKKAAACLDYGTHGTTFGGAPISAAAGLAAIRYIIGHRLPENARKLGRAALRRLLRIREHYPGVIKDIRGLGLIIGIEMSGNALASRIFDLCLENGLIVNVTGGNIVRFLPPLVITGSELGKGLDIFEDAVRRAAV